MMKTLWFARNIGRTMRVGRLTVLMAAMGMGMSGEVGIREARVYAAEASWPVVRVDGGKDLGQVNPLWRDYGQGGESADPEYLAPVVEMMQALRPRIIRVDHLFDYYVPVTARDGQAGDALKPNVVELSGGRVADFTALHRVVDLIEAMDAEPLLCVSYVPKGLAGGRRVIDPPDPEAWADLVRALVREMEGRPRPARYYEVWNEPNLESFWGGTREEFLDLYAVTARAIRAELGDERASQVRIGGAGFAEFAQPWMEALLDRVVRDGLPFDFLSWHKYATSAEMVSDQVYLAQALCRARGLEVELILDEWNYDAGLAAGNDDHRGAVYIADHLAYLVDTPLAYAPFFEIKDGDESADEFWGRWGLITHRHTPKAGYFAMLAHQRLGDRRLAMTSEAEDVGGLATRRGDDVVFTLYNRSNQGRWVRLELANISAKSSGSWRRWLIDACHSNPALAAPTKLQLLEDEVPVLLDGDGPRRKRDDVRGFSRNVYLTPMSVSLIEFVAMRDKAGPVECEVEVLPGAGQWRRGAVVRVKNASDEAVTVGPVRLWDNEGEMLRSAQDDRGEVVYDAGQMEISGGEVVEVPFEVEFYPSAVSYLYSLRASVEVAGYPEVRASTVVPLPATVDVRLEPYRVPWPGEAARLPVELKLVNQSDVDLRGTLSWRNDASIDVRGRLPERYALEAGRERVMKIEMEVGGCPADRIVPADMVVEARLAEGRKGNDKVASRVRLVPSFKATRLTSEIEVDGKLGDWSDIPVTSRLPRPDRPGEGYPLRIAWDEEGLVMALDVADAHHHQPYSDGRMWQGDSVQFAFDVAWDDEPGEGYNDSILEMIFALGPEGPVAWVYEDLGDGADNRRLDVPLAIRRTDGRTRYEMRLPWSVFGGRRPPFGMSAVLNDVDGEGAMRRWSEWGGGVAGRKDPGEFLHLVARGE